jgi:hypothetical protein
MNSNPYAAPAALSAKRGRAGEVHRIANAALIIGSALLGGLLLLSQVLKLLGLFDAHSSTPADASDSYLLGQAFSFSLAVGWALGSFVCGPIVAYGLLAKRPWAARWARNYWFLSLFSCCCTLPAIYGLLSTTSARFRQLFDEAG